MKKYILNMLTCAVLSVISLSAFAAPIDVISYDITNTRLSGSGQWQHTYDGNKQLNQNGLYDYTGGSGTLNDGKVGTSLLDTQLFQVGDNSTITLHLGSSVTISDLALYSFAGSGNSIPGNILGLYVTINNVTEYIVTSGFGPANTTNGAAHVHEWLNFAGTALEGLITDTIMLSGFVADGLWSTHYGISEVMVYGEPASAPVSEPAGLLLLGAGLVVFGVIGRRKV